jgi:hypothetical protein
MAATAAPCRREEAIDGYRALPAPTRLVVELAADFAECGVSKALAQLGSREGCKGEILEDDYIVAFDDLGGELVYEVLAAVRHARMYAGEPTARSLAATTAGLGTGVASLSGPDLSSGSTCEARGSDAVGVVADHDVDEAEVNSDNGARLTGFEGG